MTGNVFFSQVNIDSIKSSMMVGASACRKKMIVARFSIVSYAWQVIAVHDRRLDLVVRRDVHRLEDAALGVSADSARIKNISTLHQSFFTIVQCLDYRCKGERKYTSNSTNDQARNVSFCTMIKSRLQMERRIFLGKLGGDSAFRKPVTPKIQQD